MDFSSNDYVLRNYDDRLSLDCEECLVLEQLGDIPLDVSNNSLTENSLQEKNYEQQGHTTVMLLMEFDVVEGSSEKITDVQSSHFQKDNRGIILD
jgi:predicted NACHT family NTPase